MPGKPSVRVPTGLRYFVLPLSTRVRGRGPLLRTSRCSPSRNFACGRRSLKFLRGGSHHTLAQERWPFWRSLPSSPKRTPKRSSYPRALGLLLGRRATQAVSARDRAPLASPRGLPIPGPARAAHLSGAARRTRSRTSRSPGCPRACARLRRRSRGRPPSRRFGSWGCTSTSVSSFPKDCRTYVPDATNPKRRRGLRLSSRHPYSPNLLEGVLSKLRLCSSRLLFVKRRCAKAPANLP